MSNAQEIDLELYDTRIVERNILEGKLDRATWDAYLAALPDDADDAEATECRMGVDGEPDFGRAEALEAAAAEAAAAEAAAEGAEEGEGLENEEPVVAETTEE